jgi:hypothetical protein
MLTGQVAMLAAPFARGGRPLAGQVRGTVAR